ncbi:hypothetical protein GCM10023194_70420 [Planotetraspora phitsanulokensis]|uniref:Uncharacterized protein n=1 Tax=Planotetraspora phitsanulokensis TaxID=575192 RepID=A0A8J3XDS5_9ACTN|nr:hypothetical protein [Planotetraspora phitsanulokensis]GII36756.1 hypothetical protein Pph01_17590 [Planotetraspora phitsanulokensis]
MDRARLQAEVALPGLIIGLLAGAMAGGLTLVAGHSATWALVSALSLAVPLGLLGAGYGMLLGRNLFQPGVFAPAGVYWLVGFPLGRLIQETVTSQVVFGRVALSDDLPAFLAFQAVVSLGFAIGFVWLHERLAPQWFMRVADGNPVANELLGRYVAHAEALWRAREQRRAFRRREKGAR